MIADAKVNDAKWVLDRCKTHLATARENEWAQLVALLEKRVATLEDLWTKFHERAHEYHASNALFVPAEAEFKRASAAYQQGSLDRVAALKLRDDLEHARQVFRLRENDHNAKLRAAEALLDAMMRYRKDEVQRTARGTTQGLAIQSLKGYSSNIEIPENAGRNAEETAWWPMMEAETLRQYPKEAKQAVYGGRSLPIEILKEAYEKRRQMVASRAASLDAQIASLAAERAAMVSA